MKSSNFAIVPILQYNPEIKILREISSLVTFLVKHCFHEIFVTKVYWFCTLWICLQIWGLVYHLLERLVHHHSYTMRGCITLFIGFAMAQSLHLTTKVFIYSI